LAPLKEIKKIMAVNLAIQRTGDLENQNKRPIEAYRKKQ